MPVVERRGLMLLGIGIAGLKRGAGEQLVLPLDGHDCAALDAAPAWVPDPTAIMSTCARYPLASRHTSTTRFGPARMVGALDSTSVGTVMTRYCVTVNDVGSRWSTVSSQPPPNWAHWLTAGVLVFGPAALLLVIGDSTAAVVAVVFGLVMVTVGGLVYPGPHPVRTLLGRPRHPDLRQPGRHRRTLSIALVVLASAGSLSIVINLLMGEVALGSIASLIVALGAGCLLVYRLPRS